MPKTLKDLTAREVLALAIQAEEEDGRIYADLAERIGKDYPETAKSLKAMHDEENGHRHRLIELFRKQFGEHIPLIRREDETMEDEARSFYQAAIAQTSDAAVRQLLGDLAAEEGKHYEMAEEMD